MKPKNKVLLLVWAGLLAMGCSTTDADCTNGCDHEDPCRNGACEDPCRDGACDMPSCEDKGTCIPTCETGHYPLANGTCKLNSDSECGKPDALGAENCIEKYGTFCRADGTCSEHECDPGKHHAYDGEASHRDEYYHYSHGCVDDVWSSCGPRGFNCGILGGIAGVDNQCLDGQCNLTLCMATHCMVEDGVCEQAWWGTGRCKNRAEGECTPCAAGRVCRSGVCEVNPCADESVCTNACKDTDDACGPSCEDCTMAYFPKAGICVNGACVMEQACREGFHMLATQDGFECEINSGTHCGLSNSVTSPLVNCHTTSTFGQCSVEHSGGEICAPPKWCRHGYFLHEETAQCVEACSQKACTESACHYVPGITVTTEDDMDTLVVSERGAYSAVTLQLRSKPRCRVSVYLKSTDETEAIILREPNNLDSRIESILFFPEEWNVPKTFYVQGIDDPEKDPSDPRYNPAFVAGDGHQQLQVTLTAASEDPGYHRWFMPPLNVVNLDRDGSPEIVVVPWELYMNSEKTTVSFSVNLTHLPAGNVTFPVHFASDPDSQLGLELNQTYVSFTPTNWDKPRVIHVTVPHAPTAPFSTPGYDPPRKGGYLIQIDVTDEAPEMIYGTINPHDVMLHFEFLRYDGSKPDPVCVEEVLEPGYYLLQVWGAQGGMSLSQPSTANRGGYANGVLTLQENTRVWKCSGGKGGDEADFLSKCPGPVTAPIVVPGGYNGGGNGGTTCNNGYVSGGGGASDIRIGMNTLYHRVIVAGGGGGNGGPGTANDGGGYGGGMTGRDGSGSVSPPNGKGGTQTAGGAAMGATTVSPCNVNDYAYLCWSSPGRFGYGGGGNPFSLRGDNVEGSGGGGGGWYGGSGGNRDATGGASGGGGSAYALRAASQKPPGYALDGRYYLGSWRQRDGSQNMPSFSTPGVCQYGQRGDGGVRIVRCTQSNCSDRQDDANPSCPLNP